MAASESRVRECLSDLERYFSDHLPPLLVAESVEELLRGPARLIAAECQSWADQQFRVHESAVPISDLVFHAAKKLHVLGEMELVPRQALAESLEVIKAQLVAACPDSERAVLAAKLERMGSSKTALTQAVDYLIRPEDEDEGEGEKDRRRPTRLLPGQKRGGAGTAGDVTREVRRFELLIERLGSMLAASGVAPPAGSGAATVRGEGSGTVPKERGPEASLLSELYATAATGARDADELRVLLRQLRSAGLDSIEPNEMMRSLARSLPDWVVPEGKESLPAGGQAEAMERLVSLAEDPKETQERLWELVKAAIEQLNEGAVGRSVAILDVAQRLLEKEEIREDEVARIRGSASQFLDTERLQELAANPEAHRPLRRILEFFPKLQPSPLLRRLSFAEERQERRLVLSLLTVHGLAARGEILDHLEESEVSGRHDAWQVQRNLVYLLRRIDPPGGELAERELQMVLDLSNLERPLPLVREAVGHLGQVGGERAVGALVKRLRQLEDFMESSEAAPHPKDELRKLLSFLVVALARTGDAGARAEVVRHGLEHERGSGGGGERLAEALGAVDLSSTPDLVDRLLAELRSSLPVKILGLTMHRRTERAAHLIRALGSTPAPRVEEALREVVDRFSGTGLADLARELLADMARRDEETVPERVDVDGLDDQVAPSVVRAPRREIPGLEGDLDLFGFPALLQSLAQARRTGELRIVQEEGEERATLVLREGRLVECRRGRLRGESAFYSLIEEPFGGTFFFSSRTVRPTGEEEPELMPLMMEGMRRFDELRRASVVVPGDAKLEPTGRPPSSPPDEEGTFVHEVWGRVKGGGVPREIEQAIAVDPYRIRTLLAHWVEEGALRLEFEERS